MKKIRLFKDDRMWLQQYSDSLILCGGIQSCAVLIDVPNLQIVPIPCACGECLPRVQFKVMLRIATSLHLEPIAFVDSLRSRALLQSFHEFWRDHEGLFIRIRPNHGLSAKKFASERDLANFLSVHKLYDGQYCGKNYSDGEGLRQKLFNALM